MSSAYNYRKTGERLKTKGPEKKTLDEPIDQAHTVVDSGFTSTTNFIDLAQGPYINQGSDLNQRVGARVRLRNINARLLFRPAVFDGNTVQFGGNICKEMLVRVICVVDYQSNGAAVTATDLLVLDNTSTFSVFAMRNMRNSTRFRTLVDDTFSLHEMFTGDTMYAHREYNFKVDIPILFNAQNNVGQANMTENSIRWFIVCLPPFTDPALGANTLQLHTDGVFRYRYRDQ
jgi:hypothetical protein